MENNDGRYAGAISHLPPDDVGRREVRTGWISEEGAHPYQWWISYDDVQMVLGTRRKGSRRFVPSAVMRRSDSALLVALLAAIDS